MINNLKLVCVVGVVNGKNFISIIVLCYWIIGVNGKFIGYVGGFERKEWLLKYEGLL